MATDEQDQRKFLCLKIRKFHLYLAAAFYFIGCLLYRYGVVDAAANYGDLRVWKLKPEPHFFDRLGDGLVTLLLPAFANFSLICFGFVVFGLLILFVGTPLALIFAWILHLWRR